MAGIRGITIELGLSGKSVQKLRAIAKHAEALADELDAIENGWQCEECGSYSYSTFYTELLEVYVACSECGKKVESDELPTSLEGSE